MLCIVFEAPMYVWTGKGSTSDAARVNRGQTGIVLSKERWRKYPYEKSAYTFLLDDGRIAWTPIFDGIKIVEMYSE